MPFEVELNSARRSKSMFSRGMDDTDVVLMANLEDGMIIRSEEMEKSDS